MTGEAGAAPPAAPASDLHTVNSIDFEGIDTEGG